MQYMHHPTSQRGLGLELPIAPCRHYLQDPCHAGLSKNLILFPWFLPGVTRARWTTSIRVAGEGRYSSAGLTH